jgi:predicted anti-sigma-YlaC factor YlaD
MSREQEEELIIRFAMHEESAEDRVHLQECSACRQEVERTLDALRSFRGSVREWSEKEAEAAQQAVLKPVRRSLVASWGPIFAVLLLLAFIGSRYLVTRDVVKKGSPGAVDTDAVLLKQVNTDLTRGVPSGMEPLLTLVSPEGREATVQLP